MDAEIIERIGGLLVLCGIASIRNFLPTFVFLMAARFLPGFEWCPAALQDLAAGVPAVMLGDWVLGLFGALAVVELVANWNDTVREVLEDSSWETYFKPLYAFVFSVVAGAPVAEAVPVAAQVVMDPAVAESVTVTAPPPSVPEEGLPYLAWIWTVAASGAAGFGTWLLCRFRVRVAGALRAVDPDDTFRLHTLARCAEETTWVAVLLAALLVPAVAVVLVVLGALGALAARGAVAVWERRHGHPCPSCGAYAGDAALVCPACGEDQPRPYRAVGFFGVASRRAVDPEDTVEVLAHHRALLAVRRCPVCASPLKDGFVCARCGAEVWERGVSRADFVAMLDRRVIVILAVSAGACVVPVAGFVAGAVAMNVFCLNVLRLYEGRLGRLLGRVLFRIVRMSAVVAAVLLSAVPGIGLLLLVPYLVLYLRRRRGFLAAGAIARGGGI